MLTTIALLCYLPVADTPVPADIVIRGATIYDGGESAGRVGDVAIRGDRIAAVGTFAAAGNPKVIDGAGLAVAPGFIDLHTHCDSGLATIERRANLSFLTQGVTTVVTGNCGSGPFDVAAFFKKLDEQKIGCNVIHLAPHNAIREKVMGNVDRSPTDAELASMKQLVDRAMRDGAWGMSTGLEYTPGTYSKIDELVELSKVVAGHGGFYASHMRDEDAGVLQSIDEVLNIGRRANVRVHISHLKAGSKVVWGKSADAIAMIQQARDRGQKVTADQYPYRGWSTGMAAALVPRRFRSGTGEEYRARLDDPEQGQVIRKAILDAIALYDADTAFQVVSYGKRPAWQGKTLGAIAAAEKRPVIEIVLEIERNGGASVVGLTMNEEDVRVIMKQPFVATASDGNAAIPSATVPHPRSYGTFPRKIGRYAIDDKVVSLERALRSSTGLPADILELTDRGYLKPGYVADIVVLDLKTFRDLATFEKPHQYSTGVRHLFVNGVPTIVDGKYADALAGRALRHASRSVANGGGAGR